MQRAWSGRDMAGREEVKVISNNFHSSSVTCHSRAGSHEVRGVTERRFDWAQVHFDQNTFKRKKDTFKWTKKYT